MKKVVVIIALILFLIPLLLSGDKYFLGGDEGLFYYFYPKEYIKNFASNIVADNTVAGASMGYNPLFYYIPFLGVVYLLKQIPLINTQGLMYGINLALGFVFFYMILDIWITQKDPKTTAIKIISSLGYLFSPFLIGTLYLNQNLLIYFISIIPATVYFFVKGFLEEKIPLLIVSILIFSILSTMLLTFSWWSAFALTYIPIIFYLAAIKPKYFIKYAVIGSVIFFFINFYWIFHFLYSFFTGGGGQSTLGFYSGSGMDSENLRIAQGVTQLYSPLNVIFQNMHSKVPSEWSWFSYLNIFYLSVIVFAGIKVVKEKSKQINNIYYLNLFCLIISWYLFSPNIGKWGPDLFVYLVKNVPFFGAFRNMYDKFSLSLSFFYAFSFAVSFYIILRNAKKLSTILTIISVILISTSLINYINLYSDERIAERRVSGKFDEKYYELMNYLSSIDNGSRIMWLPLNSPTYTYIEDAIYPGSYYSGSSPTRILANKTDFTGRFSFIVPGDIFLGDKIVFELLPEGKYNEVAKYLQYLNVRYLIVDHRKLPESVMNVYFDKDRKILKAQSPQFYNEILGNKLKDIGDKFTVYEISQAYTNDKIMLLPVESLAEGPSNSHKKLNSYSYSVKVERLKNNSDLVFKEAYDNRWSLYLVDGEQKVLYDSDHQNTQAEFYGNKWNIDTEYIRNNYSDNFYYENEDGSINMNFIIYFEPQKYVLPSAAVSFVTLVLIISYYLISNSQQYFKVFKNRNV